MRILVSSKNSGKIKEIKSIFKEHEILSLSDIGVDIDVVEDSTTFEGNAMKKAVSLMRETGEICLADDSGLEVDFLDGAPGVYSARYAGEGASDDDRINKLLTALSGVPREKRTARFVCAVALVFPNCDIKTARGICGGFITEEPRGTGGFGYDPIFEVKDMGKTFSELSDEQKDKLSHRAAALELLRGQLQNRE